MKNTMIKTYTELCKFKTYEERLKYLAIGNGVGEETFGSRRYLNQQFYRSAFWKRLRNEIIFRDNGCDLGIESEPIYGKPLIHHMNPITKQDVLDRSDIVLDPEFLITTTRDTHNAIHYGRKTKDRPQAIERNPFDTCPWRK